MQAARVAVCEPDALQRLGQRSQQVGLRRKERRRFAQSARAVGVASCHEEIRDLGRLDEHCLAPPSLGGLEIHRDTSPCRVGGAAIVDYITRPQARDLGNAEPTVKRHQQRDCCAVATKEAHHRRQRMHDVLVHGSVWRGRKEPIPARDTAARHLQRLKRGIEMLEAVQRVPTVAFPCSPRGRALRILGMNIVSQPIVRIVPGI